MAREVELRVSSRAVSRESAFEDDSAKLFVGVAAEVGAGGDHDDDRLGEFGIEAGEFGAEVHLVVVVPERPEDPFEFSRLAGTVADRVDENRDR